MKRLQNNDRQSSAQSIKIASREENPQTLPVVWFAALVYFTTKSFPLCQPEEISLQEEQAQKQEAGLTDIYH